MERPAAIVGDTATSEAAVLHALDVYEAERARTVDVVLLVQCTSPFVSREDIDGVARAVAHEGADTAVTVAPFHGFVWRDGHAVEEGTYGVNHDKSVRPRRQDRPQDYLETGAAYAMDAAGFRTHRHRFFGHTALVRTDPARVLEIDDPHDLARARALAPLLDPSPLPSLADVDAVVLDFDGTQTDDRVMIDSDGRETVAVHRGDGLGIAALRKGVPLLILSTEQNPVVAARARKLQVPVLHGIDRKDEALKRWCDEHAIAPERVLYVGNDVNDLPCFSLELARRGRLRPRLGPRRRARCHDHPRRLRRHPRDRGLAAGPHPDHPFHHPHRPHHVRKHHHDQHLPPAHLRHPHRPGHPVYITGEIGINHNGDLDNAIALIDAAAEAATPSSSRSAPRRSAPRATSGTSSATPRGAG